MAAWEEQNLYERIKTYQNGLEARRSLWDDQVKQVAEYTRPDLITETNEQGKFVGSKIVEGTPPWAAGVMASGFRGNLISPSIEWFRYSEKQQELAGNDDVNEWLQNRQEHMYSVYRNSDLYANMHSFVLNGVTIGSPVILIEEDEQTGKICTTVPHYTENYLIKDRFGNDIGYHRKYDMYVRDFVRAFGKDNKSISQTTQQLINSGKYWDKAEVIMAIYRADDEIFERDAESDTDEKPDRKWMQYYIENSKQESATEKKPLYSKGFHHKPFSAWHYMRLPNEDYSRTPAWFGMSDIKATQAIWISIWDIIQQQARPSQYVLDTIKGRARFGPGGITWVSSQELAAGPEGPSKLVNKGLRSDIGLELGKHVNEKVERLFAVQLFMMLMKWQWEKKAPPTATQVAGMIGEQTVLLSAGIESFAGPLLRDIDEQFTAIEEYKGELPEPPDIVLEYAAMEKAYYGESKADKVDVNFMGSLAQAQKIQVGLRKIYNSLGIAGPIIELYPHAVHKARWDKMLERAFEEIGIPQDEIVPEEEFKAIVQEINQVEQLKQLIGGGREMAAAVKDLQGATDRTSPLAALTGE